jgi:hypothetical protein
VDIVVFDSIIIFCANSLRGDKGEETPEFRLLFAGTAPPF